nr:phosphatase domain-containing protein [uncultured Aurantimicrobium sp.]
MHRAARIEDSFHAYREKRARKRGYAVTVVPYPGYGSTEWVRVLSRVLLTRNPRPGSRAARKMKKRSESVRGWRSFVAVPVNDVSVTITINNIHTVVKADRGGVVDVQIPMKLSPGMHTVQLQAEGSEVTESTIHVISPKVTVGLVSDVDDTVMVTALPRPFLAAWNSFVLDEHARVPTPGMAVFLSRIAAIQEEMPVMYLSTGAWNVAPTLRRFLGRNLYPKGTLLLTDWGPTHDRMFRSGRAHKETQLRRLASEFPKIKWILVGDDGQHDEAIYAAFEKEHPESVKAVAIRQLSNGEAVLAGGRKKAEEHIQAGDAPWVYAPDGAGLSAQLSDFNVL